jgi:pimeloyl-ACP methyl ester carboxylesterase
MSMAASGIHPKQVNELNSIADYYEPLIEFLKSLPQDERVILVGHSYGGTCISMAMEFFPKKIAVSVFVTAFMHSPDLCFLTILQEVLN